MKKFEFLKICGIKEGEEHHIKQARNEYICASCKEKIIKKEFYYAVLSTLPMGYRRICNVIIDRLCMKCAKKDNSYATQGDFNERNLETD